MNLSARNRLLAMVPLLLFGAFFASMCTDGGVCDNDRFLGFQGALVSLGAAAGVPKEHSLQCAFVTYALGMTAAMIIY